MYCIEVRRATEADYGLLSEKGKVLEFNTENEARSYYLENIKNKSTFIISLRIVLIKN